MTEVVGVVVRLQVQRSPLKPAGVYDPSPLLEVPQLEVGPRGCTGLVDGTRVLDAHHADHPATRNRRLANGLSLLPRPHYAALRARFGPHLLDGLAGESVLLDAPGLPDHPLEGDLLLETVDGDPLRLTGARGAPPCLEFSRFALADLEADHGALAAALDVLDGGVRGTYVAVDGTGTVERGCRLLRG